jgi:hypothetical protein
METAKLLVEGRSDESFFSALFRQMGAHQKIRIMLPSDLDFENTVSYFPKLIDLLARDLENDRLHHLGIVADADHVSGGGFVDRWQTLTECLEKNGYRIPKNPPKLPCSGSVFKHSDGLPPVGLFLMPNHQDNGMLEDLLWNEIRMEPENQKLREYANKVITDLPSQVFSDFHRTKALLYSWLAWQKRPGQTLDVLVNGKLVDLEMAGLKGLSNWLKKVFPFI